MFCSRVRSRNHIQRIRGRCLGSLLLPGCFFWGCTTGPHAEAPGATESFFGQSIRGIERYFPMANGVIFHYETEVDNTDAVGVFVVEVSRTGELVELKTGTRTRRLQVTPQAISDLSRGGYVLKAPLDLGATWEGQSGAIQVTAVDQAVQVKAGSFTGCLVTLEEIQATAVLRQTETTFCPNVGIVSVHVRAVSGDSVTGEIARLRSYGEKIDIFKMDSRSGSNP